MPCLAWLYRRRLPCPSALCGFIAAACHAPDLRDSAVAACLPSPAPHPPGVPPFLRHTHQESPILLRHTHQEATTIDQEELVAVAVRGNIPGCELPLRLTNQQWRGRQRTDFSPPWFLLLGLAALLQKPPLLHHRLPSPGRRSLQALPLAQASELFLSVLACLCPVWACVREHVLTCVAKLLDSRM